MGVQPFYVKRILENLNMVARDKIPKIKPLIISTNYYEKIKVYREHMFFIYYAYYGHGKTHGVALKLYHEALNGELEDTFDVIVLQLRDVIRKRESNPLELTKQMKGVDPVLALIASSLIIGISKRRCGSLVECNCYSTIAEKIGGMFSFNIDEVARGLRERGPAYLVTMIREIVDKTGKTLVLVFDEFEELIKEERFILTGETPYEFLYKLATILRRDFFDKGFTKFKVVALIQKAVLSEYTIKKLLEKLSRSAEAGTTIFEEIEPYHPEIYADYVISALKRIDTLSSIKIGQILINDRESLLRNELEKSLRPLSIVPPRIAFYIAQDFIANLIEEVLMNKAELQSSTKVGVVRDCIRSASERTLNSMKKLSDITKLYILLSTKGKVMDDKTTIRKNDVLNKMITFIAREILGCIEARTTSFKYSTYYGTICIESIKPDIIVNIVLLKLSHSSKTRIDRASINLANELAKSIAELMHLYLRVRGVSTQGLPKTRIKVYPIIRRKAFPSLIYPIIEYAVDRLKDLLSERLANKLNVSQRKLTFYTSIVNPYIMDEEDAIILYHKVVKSGRGTLFSDYIERRYEDLINSIKGAWK